MDIEAIVKKYAGDIRLFGDVMRAALTELSETHAIEMRAYEATVENLEERIRQLEAERLPEGMRQTLFSLISNTEVVDDDYSGENVAIALCSYFEGSGARPDDDEPKSDDHCWGAWVEERYAATVYAIADRIISMLAAATQPKKEGE